MVLVGLMELGIVRELTARKRNRLLSYSGYVEIVNRGTDLPSGSDSEETGGGGMA